MQSRNTHSLVPHFELVQASTQHWSHHIVLLAAALTQDGVICTAENRRDIHYPPLDRKAPSGHYRNGKKSTFLLLAATCWFSGHTMSSVVWAAPEIAC